jgi:hypothetical protein
MTAYNREDLIASAIESVLAQTLTDFELIVVDDGSSDGTVAVAERYLADSRVRVVRNQRNLGDYPNRNYAATLANGEFLKYHDSDDLMYPHCLSVMVCALRSHPTAAFALSGSRSWPGGACPMLLTPRLAYQREFLGSGLFQLGPSGALFRSAAFHDLGGFAPGGAASDYLFWLKACAKLNVLLVSGDLFYYRVHSGQEMASPKGELDYARSVGAAWLMLKSPHCPLAADEIERAKRNWAYVVARGVVRLLLARKVRYPFRILRHAQLAPLDWVRYLRRPRRDAAAGTPREQHESESALR